MKFDYKWKPIPLHIKFLLLFVEPKLSADWGSDDYDCIIETKTLFGVTYVVSEKHKPAGGGS